MRTIGLIGGMSWESSQHYYRIVNEEVRARLGGLHSALCVMYSVDFAPIARMQTDGRWAEAGAVLADAAERLERAGAEVLVLCTNTMHDVATAIEARVRVPLLHIADPTAEALRARGLSRVGLLGTQFTMERAFYRDRLARHGLDVRVPEADDRAAVHRIIYDELCLGRIVETSRATLRASAERLVAAGAEAVILGCTELGMLVAPGDLTVPVFDTTDLHARAAVAFALA